MSFFIPFDDMINSATRSYENRISSNAVTGGGGQPSSSGGVGRSSIVDYDSMNRAEDITKGNNSAIVSNPFVGDDKKVTFGEVNVDITDDKQLNSMLNKLINAMNANSVALSDYNNANSYVSWDEYRRFNEKQAKDLRDWQEMMSNTAHQREMEDLRKAGLNPLLTGKYGGASTPSGAMASVSQQSMFGAQSSETANKVVAIASLFAILMDVVSNAFKANTTTLIP